VARVGLSRSSINECREGLLGVLEPGRRLLNPSQYGAGLSYVSSSFQNERCSTVLPGHVSEWCQCGKCSVDHHTSITSVYGFRSRVERW